MDLEARQAIAEFLADKMDAATLEDGLEDLAWGADSDVVNQALLMLHEYTNGDWTLGEVRDRLHALAGLYELTPRNATAASAIFTLLDRRSARAETLRVAASA
jgi:predicted transcriptional regulator